MKTFFKFVAGLIGLVVLMAALAVALMSYLEYPGGMPSSYRATDYDRRLTGIAREAAPIIAAIGRFYAAHHACPRAIADFGAVTGFEAVTRGNSIDFQKPHAIVGWSYAVSRQSASACSLWRKLGWDPALTWIRDGDKTRWIFVPGDGSEEIPIKLDGG